jgi:hypothetical protein
MTLYLDFSASSVCLPPDIEHKQSLEYYIYKKTFCVMTLFGIVEEYHLLITWCWIKKLGILQL